MDWRHKAVCRDEDPELFFPLGDKFLDTSNPASPLAQQITEAKAICSRCPVILDCRNWARAAGMTGIWGGLTEDERNVLPAPARRITFPAPAPAASRGTR
jgi:WhiB family redox-sensing transcriptional regulator